MNNLFRGLIAGWGAKKLGGGCFGMIIVFIIIWVALGQCEGQSFGIKHRHLKQKQVQQTEEVKLLAAKKE